MIFANPLSGRNSPASLVDRLVGRIAQDAPRHQSHFCPDSGAISTVSLLDRLLGRMSAMSRGEVIDGINDHGTSEYIRHFQQAVINSEVPLAEKAVSALGDAFGDFMLKVRA